jgi:hypothetical protein
MRLPHSHRVNLFDHDRIMTLCYVAVDTSPVRSLFETLSPPKRCKPVHISKLQSGDRYGDSHLFRPICCQVIVSCQVHKQHEVIASSYFVERAFMYHLSTIKLTPEKKKRKSGLRTMTIFSETQLCTLHGSYNVWMTGSGVKRG